MKISVKVKFEKRKEKVKKTGENRYTVFVKSVPRQGIANSDVIKEVAKFFKKNIEDVKIISGAKQREKIIWIKE